MTLSEQVAKLEKELAQRTAECMSFYEKMCELRDEVQEAEVTLLNANACIMGQQKELKELRAQAAITDAYTGKEKQMSDEIAKLHTLLGARDHEINMLRAATSKVKAAIRWL